VRIQRAQKRNGSQGHRAIIRRTGFELVTKVTGPRNPNGSAQTGRFSDQSPCQPVTNIANVLQSPFNYSQSSRCGVAAMLESLETLQRLIQTPSVNPMGREVTGPIYGESRMTDLLVRICEQEGWRWLRRQVHPSRDNLLALIEGYPAPRDGGELLLWDVHQDTVPPDGMSVEPFAGQVRDGRVYGRGACDVKGSMAAMLAALSRVQRSAETFPGPSLKATGIPAARPTILLACTVNEECGFTGAQDLSRMWSMEPLEDFILRRPDAAIVAEPTGLDVVVAHQGQVRWRCHTIGRAAHTSRPDAGVNAIYAMANVVQAIERYHAELSTRAPEHPLCGRPSVCVSTIHGGVAINTVPERATIEIDRRLAPGETPEAAYESMIRDVSDSAALGSGRSQIQHDQPFMQSAGLSDGANRAIAERLAGFVRQLGQTSDLIGVPFGTDAAAISAAGVPTVVFGPGSIEQAHTADEYISIDELQLATEIFYRIACNGLRESGS
jgi:acetylornithine deacetylase/succinyl-diaminopimelate desuccinylase-like protein